MKHLPTRHKPTATPMRRIEFLFCYFCIIVISFAVAYGLYPSDFGTKIGITALFSITGIIIVTVLPPPSPGTKRGAEHRVVTAPRRCRRVSSFFPNPCRLQQTRFKLKKTKQTAAQTHAPKAFKKLRSNARRHTFEFVHCHYYRTHLAACNRQGAGARRRPRRPERGGFQLNFRRI